MMNIDEMCSYRVDCCGCPKENNCAFLEKKAKKKAKEKAKKNMSIKELCNNQEECKSCPFHDACILLDCNAPFGYDEDDDKAITKSIIETAKKLQEDKNND